MPGQKDQATSGGQGGNGQQSDDDLPEGSSDGQAGPIDLGRREYLKLTATGATALGGAGMAGTVSGAISDWGPANTSDWNVVFEDHFSGSSLDTTQWGVGFGWGRTTNSPEVISEEHVNVADSMLMLTADHDGDEINAGAINSKDKFFTGPGSYWEARIKAPKRVGYLPAFWSKPNSEAWPPEIDFFEVFSTHDDPDVWSTANYNIHYSTSTDPGDGSTHDAQPVHYNTGVDLTTDFHVYGCRWLTDRVDFYFDGQLVGTVTDATTMEALRRGAPFYMMCNIHIDRTGTTDKNEPWTEPDDTMFVDWIRVWELGDGSETTDTSEGDHYVWFRSADGNAAEFVFETSGGNVHYDTSGYDADYWISDDGHLGGGTVAKTSQLPGFWYDGEIVDFTYSGPLEVFIDNTQVDPDSLVDPDNSGPSEPTSGDHTLTVDGSGTGYSSYSITVSDGIGAAETLNEEDSIDGTTATGAVNGGLDEYVFNGSLEEIVVNGDADILVDGVALQLLVVERGPDSNGMVNYIVETSGEVVIGKTSENEKDSTARGKASGKVGDWMDRYWLHGGSIVDVTTFGGNVVTTLDGTVVDATD